MKATIWIICGVLLLAVGIVGWQAIALNNFAHHSTSDDHTPVIFSIEPGESFAQIAGRLNTKGLIEEELRFKVLARIKGSDKALKAGEYQLTKAMTPHQILGALVSGKPVLYRLTIPEGYSVVQIAEEVTRQGLGQKNDIVQFALSPESAAAFGLDAQTLEGYLFPDTYFFPRGVDKRTIIAKMIERFNDKFLPEWHAQAKTMGMTIHEVVTLASIIEKETGAPSERPVIASVFHNRLRKGMRLESDPTVIYGIKDFDGNITRKHLKTATPYNTYTIRGLPPGPIANPGSDAIQAALYPADTDYLFFVSKKDQTHHFSRTIQEHNAAVRKYQLRGKRRPTS